jgi:hypothetical protein
MEKRGGALIDIDRLALERRMRDYYDPIVSWEELKALGTGLTEDAARFNSKKAREKVTGAEDFQPERILRYALRPFDTRWCYYSAERPLWNEPRPAVWKQYWRGNSFLLTRMNCPRVPEGPPAYFTRCLCDDHLMTPDAVAVPLRLRSGARTSPRKKDDGNCEFGSILREAAPAYGTSESKTTANLSPAARNYLAGLGINNPDADAETAALLWMHALAIGFSPAYLSENADGIRQDWPRVPLPNAREALLASAELGRRVAALLDTETSVPGVTQGKPRLELKPIAELNYSGTADFRLTAGWGHAGKGGVTMPGKGKMLTRGYQPEEENASLDLLGKATHDVYLNDTACWRNVPEKVWDFTIGGYQVLKKWLSYREYSLLGRALSADEAREFMNTARRLAALILMQPALDANYASIKGNTVPLSPR